MPPKLIHRAIMRYSPLLALCVFLLQPLLAVNAKSLRPLYLDPAQPIEARVADLVSRLTPEEKAALMKNGSPGVERLGIPKYDWWNEALHGVARAGEATVFPQAIGLASMWDEDFMQKVADTISTEARAKYHDAIRHNNRERYFGLTFWTPNINIFRDPRWGRGQETYGEDPFLTSRLGVAFVRGLQGNDPHFLKTAACAKHFAVHSGPESLRHDFDVSPDEADFHDTYLPAFEALVREAHVEIVMTAYNSVYGYPCAVNPRLYDLLYNQWKFDGHVVSDCGAIYDLSRTYKVARNDAEAEAMSVKAGLCLRCGDDAPALAEGIKSGYISEADVDVRLRQLLRTMFRLGFFDPEENVPYSKIPFSANNTPENGALALEAAHKSIVLLKNDGVLPLQTSKMKHIAVIGPNANSLPALLGNYNGTPSAPVTILAGLKAVAGEQIAIDYTGGCDYVGGDSALVAIPRTNLSAGEYTGLNGEYFANTKLEGSPAAKRRDRPVEFDWSVAKLPEKVPSENFSVRWQGTLLTGMEGEYQLSIEASGGFRLYLGDDLLIDDWTAGVKAKTISRRLPEKARLPIRVEFFHTDGPARFALKWAVPGATSGFQQALATARQADAIVFVGGMTAQLEGEEMKVNFDGFDGGDRTKIELPSVQEQLLKELSTTGKPIVLVLMSGSAVALPWASDHANAIVQAWYPGQAGGTAVADVLFGKANPAGRLPVTFYRETKDLPAFTDYSMANRTYRFFKGQPLYPFGHGLSYTQFAYKNLQVAKTATPGELSVSIDIANTGKRDGDEVVQFYAQEPASAKARANLSLCGFKRIALKAGETKTVSYLVPATALRRWDKEKNAYVFYSGEWTIQAGASSGDLRQKAQITF
ncbi:MAG: glycoside hydrolase family 3 C-terminal domain-containing protein [Nibricoccus sp.]